MTEFDEPRIRYTFLIGPAFDDVTPAFVIDTGDYDDPAAARRHVDEAAAVLDDNRVISEMATETVRPQSPASTLPSWPDFRDRHVIGGRVDETVPVASGVRTPGGWERMQVDVERSRAILREQLLAVARSIVPDAEPRVISDRGPERHGHASQDLSQERYGAFVTVGFRLGEHDIAQVMSTAASVLDELSWLTEAPSFAGRTHRLEATRGGYSLLFSVDERWKSAKLLGQTPLFRATDSGSERTESWT